METINEIAHLRRSGFGRPRPRHGLKLLYWFANECIYFENNNEIRSKYDPDEGCFGFHLFKNRYDQYGDRLLPDVDIPYYVIGNLNSPGAHQLPSYVSEDCSAYNDDDDSNTDRIIVSVDDDEYIERVYVTQHIDNSNYDPDTTFRISKGLLMFIRRMDLEKFQGSVQASSLDVAVDFSASLFPEHPVNVHNQPLTTPPSSLTPQTIPTSNVTVDLSANLSSEPDDTVDKEHPPISKKNPDIFIPMEGDFEDLQMTCWRNCAIL
ncbi:uncharacterized protein LOC130548761 [Triplophysa rosa]|uniref:Uncharacterized protein n=1 Tax=Triplophysa rosa TaxID=992332 RepID=A0A9W7T6G1_TRIRA|nr:uncharacterized protein LOC130548761 [Triplophysa rosa]KAI7791399.1 hypothetical protein IRJ41_018849 [Triplophysa rosa]